MPTIFISYSHDSPEHADRVLALANRLVGEGIDVILDQYEPAPPEGWPRWMDKKIRDANFVLMVCTETYYRRVMGEEKAGTGLGVKWEGNLIYQHIYSADTTNSRFIPILFADGKAEFIPTPLGGSTRYHVDSSDGYEALYRHITKQPRVVKPQLGKLKSLPPRERKPDYLGVKISLAKLPSTSPDLFGREDRLKELDAAWDNPTINIFSLVAWGGVGKSALVNKWLTQMGQDNFRGAERVYGWSFYSQGAAEGRQVSADQFIAAALTWFGDPDPTAGSPWDKGERLAELVKQSRTLLILDGLEPLQNPPPVETGRIKDPALVSFLREVARQNPGLVVISTRLAVDDLKDFKDGSAKETDLESLSDESGAAYLKHLGVDGTDAERQQASHDFGGHALALTLLGRYLKVVHKGDIRKRGEIPHVMDEQKQGAHARRVMESYERWLQGKPELDILRLMGLFDRPAEKGALDALRKKPAIKGLTNAIQKLSDVDWKYKINSLRELRLLAPEDPHAPDELDCHPLLREHFGEKLKDENNNAWQKAHGRLYEYYKSSAKEYPDTLEEMAPLFAAVMHGCQAGKHQEAFFDIFVKRIDRGGGQAFIATKLGAIGSALTVLSSFFDSPWRKPVDELEENVKGYVLNNAGFCLRALGRLADAAQPTQAGLELFLAEKNWINAARTASNLSEHYLTIGDVTQALAYAEQSIQFADKSGDEFIRVVARANFANALHQAGDFTKAKPTFQEAEEIQKKRQPESPLLYSSFGFQYCNLLLSQGDYAEVKRRANNDLKMIQQGALSSLLTIALAHLSLGRVLFLQSQREPNHPITESLTYLNRAVNSFRQSGYQDDLPLGLLAHAEYYRLTGDLVKAQKDVDEAFTIATRGGMGLHVADCHLEFARLCASLRGAQVATKQSLHELGNPSLEIEMTDEKLTATARKHLEIARESINKMGYHRRDKEVEELEEQLKT